MKELQERFRTQFSKIGNTREQLFHTWRSFHFVQGIRQGAAMFNFDEPQTVEVF